jgi:pimeloyl-ACP methyl ester carboxylesterase
MSIPTPATNVAQLPAEHAAFIETRLGRLHVRIIGEGATTILWPSMFVDSHTWDMMLPLLPADRRYVLVDPPGLGRSQSLHRTSDIAGAAEAAIDLLKGLDVAGPVDWLGNAFGGHVGFKLAAQRGVLRSLVAISSPAQAIPAELRKQINALLPVLRVAGPVGVVRNGILAGMLTDASAGQEAIRRVVVDSLDRPSRRSLANAVRSFILARVDVSAELADICVPSLFVASDDRGDWSPEDAEASAASTPGAAVVVVRGARTLIPLEKPEALAGHVRAFWGRIS